MEDLNSNGFIIIPLILPPDSATSDRNSIHYIANSETCEILKNVISSETNNDSDTEVCDLNVSVVDDSFISSTKIVDFSADIEDFIETVVIFYCKLCSFESSNKITLKNHLKWHKEVESESMKESLEEGKEDESATGYLSEGEGKITFSCCNEENKRIIIRKEMSDEDDETQVYICGICSIPFESIDQLTPHMNSHHNGIRKKSKAKEFLMALDNCFLNITEETEEVIKEGKHDFCNIPPECPDLTKETNIKCRTEGCKEMFSSEEVMLFHQGFHDESDPLFFKCTLCHHKFNKWLHLAAHLCTSHHSINIDLFQCSVCKYRSTSRDLLDRHYFKCVKRVCLNGSVKTKHRANGDISTDFSLPPSNKNESKECKECGQVLSSMRSLRKHMKCVHGGVRPYICQVCGFSSKTQHTLTLHTRQHTGEKPFSCTSCPFKARDHNTLRRHVRRKHLGIKPYKCMHCGYSAVESHQLKIHLAKIHPDKEGLFRCLTCPYTSLSSLLLDNHRKVNHKEGRQKTVDDNQDPKFNFSSMFPSSNGAKEVVRKYPSGVEEEESISQCYFDSDHIDTGGITIPAEETKMDASKERADAGSEIK